MQLNRFNSAQPQSIKLQPTCQKDQLDLVALSSLANEYEIMNKLQGDIDAKFQQLRPLTLERISALLDEVDQKMTQIDEEREKPIFSQRLRTEWEDALIKRYVYKETGDIGPQLTTDEMKKASQDQGGPPYVFRYEQMRMQFEAYKRHNTELEEFKSMEDCMDTLFQKYQDNLVLLVSNQSKARVPLSVNIRFKSYDDIKFMQLPDQKVRKRNKAQFMQAKDVMLDQMKQLEQVLSENELDFLKIEGNIGAEDLLKRKMVQMADTPASIVSKKIKDNVIIRYLEISKIKIRDSHRISIFRPSLRREEPNGNGPALSLILESITTAHTTLVNLEVLNITNVQLDEKIISALCLILQSNFLKELMINDCNLGAPNTYADSFLLIQKLANALSFNTSLRGIELNGNQLSDDQGCIILQSLLQQTSKPDRENPMLLQKISVRNNALSERSAAVLNQIVMKSQMRIIDIQNNQIVLRFLDNIIVTAGYKYNLEFFGIEGNQRSYQSPNSVCSCLFFRKSSTLDPEETSSQYAFTKVSPLQLQNRNQRIIKQTDLQSFITAKVNIRKHRLQSQIVRFREQKVKSVAMPPENNVDQATKKVRFDIDKPDSEQQEYYPMQQNIPVALDITPQQFMGGFPFNFPGPENVVVHQNDYNQSAVLEDANTHKEDETGHALPEIDLSEQTIPSPYYKNKQSSTNIMPMYY